MESTCALCDLRWCALYTSHSTHPSRPQPPRPTRPAPPMHLPPTCPTAGPRTAALCLGPPPPSLYSAMTGRREGQHRVRILTVGSAPPVAAYEAEESRAPGLLSLVSDLASSTAASLLGKARSYVPSPAAAAGRSLLGGLRRQRSSGGVPSVPSSASSSMADLQAAGAAGAAGQQQGRRRADKMPGEPASLAAAVWDEKRHVSEMAPSPWCAGCWGVRAASAAAAAVSVRCMLSACSVQARHACPSGGQGNFVAPPPHPNRFPIFSLTAAGAGRPVATAWAVCCLWTPPAP